MNETQKQEYYGSYLKSVHRIGRIGLAIGVILMMGAPIVMGLFLKASPDWGAFVKGFLQVAAVYWTSGVVEFLVYTPMIGAGASYLAFLTGNLVNLKMPCAANARDICGTESGSMENEIVSTLSIAASSLVTVVVLAVGVLCLVPLTPVLESPVLTPAFNNVIPALFGALACQYFSKSLRLTVLPLAVMCVVFVALPSLIGSVSFLILLVAQQEGEARRKTWMICMRKNALRRMRRAFYYVLLLKPESGVIVFECAVVLHRALIRVFADQRALGIVFAKHHCHAAVHRPVPGIAARGAV